MPQVHCYLPKKTVEQLERIKQTYGHSSLSKAVREMIESGIKEVIARETIPEDNTEEKLRLEREEQHRNQQTMYLHKILSLNTDILRCVYDKNKVPDPRKQVAEKQVAEKLVAEKLVEEKLVDIKKTVEDFTEGWVFPPI